MERYKNDITYYDGGNVIAETIKKTLNNYKKSCFGIIRIIENKKKQPAEKINKHQHA